LDYITVARIFVLGAVSLSGASSPSIPIAVPHVGQIIGCGKLLVVSGAGGFAFSLRPRRVMDRQEG